MSSPDLWYALRIKTNPRRGGAISNIHVRDIAVGTVGRAAIGCDFAYEGGEGPFPPRLSGVLVERMRVADAGRVLDLHGLATTPVSGITMRDCRFDGVRLPSVLDHADPVAATAVWVNGRPADRLD
jgi:hypothetical protein